MITANQAGAVTTIGHDYSGDDNVGLMYLTSDPSLCHLSTLLTFLVYNSCEDI